MIDNDLQKFIGTETISLAEAMKKINQNTYGILFIVDDNFRIVGSLSDGDIRRYLLAGGTLHSKVENAINKAPKFAKTKNEAIKIIKDRTYIAIPIIDDEDHVISIYIGNSNVENPKPSINIPVVINAGGKGTRLDPYTRVLPKPLIPVGELPIIEHIMQRFMSYDCKDFHIIVNYKKQIMKGYFAESEDKYDISWYDEEKPLGTGGGLTLLKGRIDKTFFFTNCDNLLMSNYDSIIRFHRDHKNSITMICAYKNLQIPYGVVEIGIDGAIKEMREKPQMSFLTNTGIYVVEPEVVEDMEDDVAIDFPDVVVQQRLKGRNVAVYPVSENEWLDMGQLPELENMRKKLYGE